MQVAIRLGALVVLVYLAWHLWMAWDETPVDFSDFEPLLLVVACAASVAGVVAYGAVWPTILRRLGAPVPHGALAIFLQSQLGKYLPGSIWQYAGRIGLARARGLPARLGLVSLGVEVAASLAAAAIVASFALPLAWALPLAGMGAATVVVVASGRTGRIATSAASSLVRLVERAPGLWPGAASTALRATPATVALYVPVWALYGAAFWLTARSLFPVPAEDLLFFTAAFALGWIAGMVVVFAPGGIGVREAVLVWLLGPRIGHPEAIVVAGASRLLLTAADLACGGLAIAASRYGRNARVPVAPELDNGRAQPS